MGKIAVIGIDPVLLQGKHLEPHCLSPLEAMDLLSYLVLETSYYTQKQFKAFRSLKAYRWFSRYVIATMLVDENKRFLISSFCSSTSNCTLQYCYLCP